MKLIGKRIFCLSIFSLFSIFLITDLSHLYKTFTNLSPNYQNSRETKSKYQKASKIFDKQSENGLLNGIFGKILY